MEGNNGTPGAEISELEQKLIRQIEYYFGDFNLIRDNFLNQAIKANNGWVKLELLVTFKRLKDLSTDFEVIVNALKKSPTQLLEVSEDGKEIRRALSKPLPENDEKRKEDINSRSVYIKGIPADATLDDLLEYFKKQRPVEHIQMRYYLKTFKGSLFVVFKTIEEAEEYLAKGEAKYGDNDLIREAKLAYQSRKREERSKIKAEGKRVKEESNTSAVMQIDEIPTYEKGYILYMNELPANTTREDIKNIFNKDEVAWVDYDKGDTECWVRFKESGDLAEKHVEKVKAANDGKLCIKESEPAYRVLEGDEEIEHYKKMAKSKEESKQMRHKSGRGKGKGHFGRGGGRGGGRGQFKNRGTRDTENGGQQKAVKRKFDSDNEQQCEASENPTAKRTVKEEKVPELVKT